MPRYVSPGVYVQEIGSAPRPIQAAETGAAAFVGPTERGPSGEVSPPLRSFGDFERLHGGIGDLRHGLSWRINYVARAAKSFFAEGGRRLHVIRTESGTARADHAGRHAAALELLEREPAVSLIAAPGYPELDPEIGRVLLAHVERPRGHRFALLELPRRASFAEARQAVNLFRSRSAALYFPWVLARSEGPSRANPTGADLCLPPSGFVAGIYGRVDGERGIHKAPANEVVRSAVGFEREVTAQEQEILNPAGVNCLRSFAGRGHRVWGARTTSLDPEWRYVSVRRHFLHLRHSLEEGLAWVAFEPNDESLWAKVKGSVESYLVNEWRSGALVGARQSEAFFVKCDRSTMTAADLAAGRLVLEVGFAPTRPAEFILFRLVFSTAR